MTEEGGWDPDEEPPPYTDRDVPWDRHEGAAASNGHGPPPNPENLSPFIDWPTFWKRDRSEADFLLDDVIARGRGHAIYAPHKTGKSLFALWAATEILRQNQRAVAIYLDYEMTEDDLQDRLEDMGYGSDSDLDRLRYWLLPTLPPLNSAHGSDHLINLVESVGAQFPGHHLAVIIDTTSRAVQGDENDSGPYQDFYRLTGLRLKQMGVTWARLDHEGKDPTKGQRGSSAKGDDVDVGWRITRTDDGIRLDRKLSRISWIPEHVSYTVGGEPMRFVRTGEQWPEGTATCAADLDRLGVPILIGSNEAVKVLRDADCGVRRQVVIAAVRYRKERDQEGTR